jgi:hypothetical protein
VSEPLAIKVRRWEEMQAGEMTESAIHSLFQPSGKFLIKRIRAPCDWSFPSDILRPGTCFILRGKCELFVDQRYVLTQGDVFELPDGEFELEVASDGDMELIDVSPLPNGYKSELVPVSLAELSNITHEVALAPHHRFESPEFLYVKFSGEYRAGAAGCPDAIFITSHLAADRSAWHSTSLIVDLSDLTYVWGDEMGWIYRASDEWKSLAIIVGDRSQAALKTLDPDAFEQYCVPSLDDAVARIRQQCIARRSKL